MSSVPTSFAAFAVVCIIACWFWALMRDAEDEKAGVAFTVFDGLAPQDFEAIRGSEQAKALRTKAGYNEDHTD